MKTKMIILKKKFKKCFTKSKVISLNTLYIIFQRFELYLNFKKNSDEEEEIDHSKSKTPQ